MEQDLETWFGRGKGDPDTFGYPDEEPKPKVPKVYRKKHWSEIVRNPQGTFEPRDNGDNWAGDPSEGWA